MIFILIMEVFLFFCFLLSLCSLLNICFESDLLKSGNLSEIMLNIFF